MVNNRTKIQFSASHSLLVRGGGSVGGAAFFGATVEFPNCGNDCHHGFSLWRTKRFEIGRYKKDEKPVPSVIFDKAGFVRLRCEIHEFGLGFGWRF